jgi:alkanesulfonate monooxygenase SsuD/methylene tetrahydromethanopterin reductase-like flavin-dependent oxidoreductase (luciferase family)
MTVSFDVFNLPTFEAGVDGPPAEMFQRLTTLTELAGNLDYHRCWFAEHHFQPHGGILSAPDILVAALAQRAPSLRFGLGVVQVPYHHPLSVAERIATLDQVTGGRLDVGLGRAFLKCEYDGFGIPMDESRSRFEEGVDVITTALRGKDFEHQGKHFAFESLRVEPACLQQPPPVWVAAATTPQTFSWAGEMGFKLMIAPLLSPDLDALREKVDLFRAAWKDTGRRLEDAEILVNVHVHVAEDPERAMTEAEPHLRRYVEQTRAAGSSAIAAFHRDGVPEDFAHYPALGRRWFDFTVAGAAARDTVLIGDPAGCLSALNRLVTALHCTTVAATFDFGQPLEVVERSMRLFAGEVVPGCRRD